MDGVIRAGGVAPAPRRTAWFVVDDLSEAAAVAARHGELLVVDLENTLVRYSSRLRERRAALQDAVEVVAATGALRRLTFLSNARFRLPDLQHPMLEVDVLTAARKPHLWLPPLRRLRAQLQGAAVYGDQPLTDGLLAHYLGGVWLQPRHAHEPMAHEPLWPRVMRAAGRSVLDRCFELQLARPGP
jgi:predicted HAD superfamily phosphohydrolase YqeG